MSSPRGESEKQVTPSPDSSQPGITAPTQFRRVGQRGLTWSLPRTFPGYFADASKQVLGASTKYVIRPRHGEGPQYLIKYAQKHGKRETLTEFFINRLGMALGLDMAHSGLILADGVPTFLTRIFLRDNEALTHGSLMIEDCFKREKTLDVKELDGIHRRAEQEFYSIDFVADVIRRFCGHQFDAVLSPFIEMLIFDALIGSMDRHSQNWGVIGTSTEPVTYRLAPIFDTARALLWSLDEAQIEKLAKNEIALQSHIEKAKPCMGPVRNHSKVNKCNHFDFVANLIQLYPKPVTEAIEKLSNDIGGRSARVFRQFPFDKGFTGNRKRLILKILGIRADKLKRISTGKEG